MRALFQNGQKVLPEVFSVNFLMPWTRGLCWLQICAKSAHPWSLWELQRQLQMKSVSIDYFIRKHVNVTLNAILCGAEDVAVKFEPKKEIIGNLPYGKLCKEVIDLDIRF